MFGSSIDYSKFFIEDYVQNPVALARICAGITQEDLAIYLKVSQAYISKIENKVDVTPKLLLRITKAIDALSK